MSQVITTEAIQAKIKRILVNRELIERELIETTRVDAPDAKFHNFLRTLQNYAIELSTLRGFISHEEYWEAYNEALKK